MHVVPLRVAKLGGSLLTFNQLAPKLNAWLAAEPARHTVLIVGGGPVVEGFRKLDAQQPIATPAVHWLCIEALSLTTRYLAQLLPELAVVDDFAQLQRRVESPGVTLFEVQQFMREIEPHRPGTCLPADWDVTSDSIAARLAVVLAADELVLLKSTSAGASAALAELAASGYVDRFLPQVARELPAYRLVNLREGV